jgi:transcriptional regulator with XRE-family HTH domain
MRKLSRDHVALGEAIRRQRWELALSQEELAARCGLHRTYVASVERGERNLGYANVLRIAAALELRPHQLVRAAERRAKPPGGRRVTLPR